MACALAAACASTVDRTDADARIVVDASAPEADVEGDVRMMDGVTADGGALDGMDARADDARADRDAIGESVGADSAAADSTAADVSNDFGDWDSCVGCGPREVLAVGSSHACATIRGALRCWGGNGSGQLGDGTRTGRLTAVTGPMLPDVRMLSLGRAHSCAILAGGALRCWGLNGAGQLGDGTRMDRDVPIALPRLPVAAHVSAGTESTCATLPDGSVWCWGGNASGQLGIGPIALTDTPVRLVFDRGLFPRGLESVVVYESHACAIDSSDHTACWGRNAFSQLGDGTHMDRLLPVEARYVGGPIVAIALGSDFSCGHSGSVMFCWGYNGHAQLGRPVITESLTGLPIPGLPDVAQMALGSRHACGRTAGGVVYCWGNNSDGQLGDGTTADRVNPRPVIGLPAATDLACRSFTCCARIGPDDIRCWGQNTAGQLGDGTTTTRTSPVRVIP